MWPDLKPWTTAFEIVGQIDGALGQRAYTRSGLRFKIDRLWMLHWLNISRDLVPDLGPVHRLRTWEGQCIDDLTEAQMQDCIDTLRAMIDGPPATEPERLARTAYRRHRNVHDKSWLHPLSAAAAIEMIARAIAPAPRADLDEDSGVDLDNRR